MYSDRIKNLFKDTGVFFLGTFSSRIIVYLLTPLYTSYLVAAEYANADLMHTALQIMIPLLTLRISSAMFRFCMDQESDIDVWLTNALFFAMVSSVPAFICIRILLYVFEVDISWQIMLGCYLTSSLSEILGGLSKAIGRNKIFAANSIINSLSLFVMNYEFLVFFRFGVSGYFISLFCSSLVSCLFYCISIRIISYIRIDKIAWEYLNKLFRYSLPLVPSALSFWVVQASDKYMVYGIISPTIAGLYSVSYKIPNIIGALVNIFSQAWEINAIKNNDNAYYSKVYTFYYRIIVVFTSVVLLLSKGLALVLFKKEFFEAYKFVPGLSIAFVFCYLQTFMEGIFVSRKETKIIMASTVLGAITNVILNLILISRLNVYGAIIATGVSYLVTYVIRRGALVKRSVLHGVNIYNVIYFILLIAEFIFYSLNEKKMYFFAFIMCSLIIMGQLNVLATKRRKKL